MKQKVHFLVIFTMLVLPLVAQAVPCRMFMADMGPQMDQQEMHMASDSAEPCPHHKQVAVEKECDNLMSLADCLDMDKVTVTDTNASKLPKIDNTAVALLTPVFIGRTLTVATAPRAPPQYHSIRAPSVSLILTTQRFRV